MHAPSIALPVRLILFALAVAVASGQPMEDRGHGPATVARPTSESERAAAALGIGRWIWTTNFEDKQVCRLWRAFTLPGTNTVRKANLRITADNLYRCYLDGREIGQGGNWRSLTDYDLTWVLDPGTHVLAIDALNDGLEGGVILGLSVQFQNGEESRILSDASWRVVPNSERRWLKRTTASMSWHAAEEVGVVGQSPWWLAPVNIITTPPIRPLDVRFWQQAWFLGVIVAIAIVAMLMSLRLAAKLAVQRRAEKLLARERTLIARDIHDDLGAGLTQLVLEGEVAQTEFPEGSASRERLQQLSEKARAVSHSLEEVLWTVNANRDTLRDFASYLCKYAQNFLASGDIRCRLDVQPEMPPSNFDLPVRRSLFLAVKESLNNAAKHSGATELFLRIHRDRDSVVVEVDDNGRGFDVSLPSDGNGLSNMQQRLAELGGACSIDSQPGEGCRVTFQMPLAHPMHRDPWWRRLFHRDPAAMTEDHPEP